MSILGGTKPDLTTSEGLTAVAEESGLGTQAKSILQGGENPKIAFSGGFIQDIFDTLNAPQSVVAGLFENKNMVDSISSRASFSDKELLGKYGMVGTIGGIIADIATDPLMLIPPLGIGKRMLQGVKGASEMIQGTKLGGYASDALAKRLVYRFGQPEEYKRLAEDTIRKINRGGESAIRVTNPITELSLAEQKLLTRTVTVGGRKVIERVPLSELPPQLALKAKPAFDELDRLGKEMVNVGLLDEAKYQENIGKYIKNLYQKYESPTVGKALFDKKPIRIDSDVMKKRLAELPDDIREALEPIMEAGYPLAKSLAQMNQAVERARFFQTVAGKFGSDVLQDGFKQLPLSRTLGKLAGKYVPESIFDDIQDIIRSKTYGEQIAGKIVRGFKYGKVILNPATHARNIISNFMLNNFAGLPALRIPEYLVKAGKSLRGEKLEKVLEPLAQEARKYKSAEEFVKAQPKLYHAGTADIKEVNLNKTNYNKTFYLSDKADYAKSFGGKSSQLNEMVVNPEAKLADMRKPSEELISQIDQMTRGRTTGKIQNITRPDGTILGLPEVVDRPNFGSFSQEQVIQGIRDGKAHFAELPGIKKVLKDLGYDGQITSEVPYAKNIGIWNKEVVKTKSQLTDFYNKAIEKGGGDKYSKEILDMGVDASTFWGAEIKSLLTKAGDPALKRIPKQIINKMGELYQKEESLAKRMMYIYQREQGLEPAQAWMKAEEATFNYAQVTPFIRKLRESLFGMPFITFTYKATPLIAKTLITNPARIGKYGFVKRGIENMSPEKTLAQERESEPDYIKKGFFVRLPFQDQHGRSLYFDMTYIMPFGDIMSGNLIESEKVGESYPTAMLRKFPFLNIIGELYQNKDFFGEPIVKAKSDDPLTIGRDVMLYTMKAYGPPPFVDTPERLVTATKISKMTEAERGSKRTITEEILRNFGLKVKPFVLEQEQGRREREKKTNLQTLLEQEGVVREFKVPFIPKQ